MDVPELPVIETPEQLADTTTFSSLLRRTPYRVDADVCSVRWAPVSQAILSQVVEVTVSYKNSPDTVWIAKFQKASLPLQAMFRVEGAFYSHHARDLLESGIHIPEALYCGEKCIVLKKIQNTISYTLLESCPTDRLSTIFRAMARMHAQFWGNNNLEDLSATAGIGTAMSGLQKEQSFPDCWPDFIAPLGEDERIRQLCASLSRRRLRDIHARVHEYRPTLIHGDFHVANILFSPNNQLWLLDWATCGLGNPMVDVVFFFLVSTRLDMTNMCETWLPHYHHELTTTTTTTTDTTNNNAIMDLSWESCLGHFRTCLLNQFIILVCYDQISKNLLANEASGEVCEHYAQHFDNVNRRCVRALLSEEMDIDNYPLPRFKTEEELITTRTDGSSNNDVIREL
jgi:tRNA A-37 threonylcarbamoyl transferase component Bud32